MAAIMNDRITDGPAFGTASTIVKKMPVPMVAPTPIMVNGNRPMLRPSRPAAGACPCSALRSVGLVRINFWPNVSFTDFPLCPHAR